MSDASQMQPMLEEFVAESQEMIDRIILQLGLIERKEHQAETVHSIYRDIHTVKGSAQLFGFHQMAQLAHCMEATLDPVRRERILLNGEFVDCLYSGLDAIKELLGDIRLKGKESDRRQRLAETLPRLVEIVARLMGGSIHPIQETMAIQKTSTETRTVSESKDSAGTVVDIGDSGSDTVRVHVNLLDSLMNMVGELVLIRNQVLQHTRTMKESDTFMKLSQRLSIVTTELQNEVVRTRMQPVGNVLNRFQRVVRDLSRDLGKQVDLQLDGAETELDKTLIEAIRDPLTHIIRNAVDHGIEMPDVRRKANKPEAGTLSVRSYHEGGQVIIEVRDDGQGLSRERIGAKAVDRGLITSEALADLSDREVFQLIFVRGFSTSDKVSSISGRGVGMDIVRNNIEKIGGTVDIESFPGHGMITRLRIPLTLAIVPALVVRAGGECFAIPQVKLVELVRLERNGDKGFPGLENLQGAPVFRLRGDLLPILSLKNVLRIGSDELEESEAKNIVVLNGDRGYFGLFVDEIVDSTDIVVKPLGNQLKSLRTYAGATVMGDGSVVLVLDIMGLATFVKMYDDKDDVQRQSDAFHHQEQTSGERSEYLLVDIGVPGRFALPLCQVNRLEEFDEKAVQYSGTQRVISYRDALLPLTSLSASVDMPGTKENDGKLRVIVIERAGRIFGFEVNRILDILASERAIDSSMKDRDGFMGSLIADGEVVVVVDIHSIIDKAIGKSVAKKSAASESDLKVQRQRCHILLVEDNGFYRKHISQFLVEAGFRVTVACDGKDGWDQISRGGEFSLVLSDIEMPRMTGMNLVEHVRGSDRHRALPMIALTTKARDSDREEGLKAGFNNYLEKLNKDVVLSELDRALKLA